MVLNFGQSVLNLSIDYLAIILLLVAGTVNLKASNGEGLLCGAWGFTACLMMRAYAWRHDADRLVESHWLRNRCYHQQYLSEESKVMSLLIFVFILNGHQCLHFKGGDSPSRKKMDRIDCCICCFY